MYTRVALASQSSACLCLPNAVIDYVTQNSVTITNNPTQTVYREKDYSGSVLRAV